MLVGLFVSSRVFVVGSVVLGVVQSVGLCVWIGL